MKLKHVAKEFLSPPIIQFGPPRTGSTLLWNVTRTLYPDEKVIKKHKLDKFHKSIFCRSHILVSIRNPLDAISSSIERYEQKPTPEVIEKHIKEYEKNGIWDVLKISDLKRVCILKYEDFAFNWDFMFSNIESLVGRKFPQDRVMLCKKKYSIEAVIQKAESLGNFSKHDPTDHIHGKHISKSKGRPNHYIDFLSPDAANRAYSHFEPFFKKFDYKVVLNT